MAKSSRTISEAQAALISVHKNEASEHTVNSYSDWAENYEEDLSLMDYKLPILAAECVSNFFEGDREKAMVLDVACGTGLVGTTLKTKGFQNFVGLDGSDKMLEVAKRKGLYQELKQCILGTTAMPVDADTYDIVTLIGGIDEAHVPATIMKELWRVAKPGGSVCVNLMGDEKHKAYKNHFELLMSKMEKEGLLTQISVMEVEKMRKATSEKESESEYIPGAVYLYRKSDK